MTEEVNLIIKSKTSSGGYISFDLIDTEGQIVINIDSKSYDGTPRTDVRVDLVELRKVLRILDAMS